MLGDKIKELRKKLNMSQARLSELSDVSISYIQQIEANKKTNPSMSILIGLADALKVTHYDLLECDEDAKNDHLIDDLKCILEDDEFVSNTKAAPFIASISSSINGLICTFANDTKHHDDIIKLYDYSFDILAKCKNENDYKKLSNLLTYMEFILTKEGE